MAHVLIGFADALPAPEVLFSLRAAGHRVSVFARQPDIPLKHLAPERIIVLPDPTQDTAAAIKALRSVMAAADAPEILLPLDDGGLWLTEAALGPDPRIAGATGQQVRVALDKALQNDAAQIAGLKVPSTEMIRTPGDLDRITAFPVIAKPALAVRDIGGLLGKGDATYLRDVEEADTLKRQLGSNMEPLMVQPLIGGMGEGVFGHATPDGVVGWSGHRRLRMMNPHGSGSSACVSWVPDPELRAQIQVFLTLIGWRGPFMIELLRDNEGQAWFMELNGRMWGSLALARRQGLEYPAWAVAAVLDPDFRPEVPPAPKRPIVQRNLGRDLLHLMFVLRGPKSDFHRMGWPGFWRSAAGVFHPAPLRAFYNYDPAHRWFFLREAFWTFRKAFRR